jgi:putative transposase
VHKHIKGRKRHILVDTLGLILAIVVTAASVQDRDGAKSLLGILRHKFAGLRLIWADQAYAGQLVTWVKALRVHRPVRLEIVKRSTRIKGFMVSPKRWIVERIFGWFNRYRQMSKDYELLPQTSEAIIRVVMIHLMIRRLARTAPY